MHGLKLRWIEEGRGGCRHVRRNALPEQYHGGLEEILKMVVSMYGSFNVHPNFTEHLETHHFMCYHIETRHLMCYHINFMHLQAPCSCACLRRSFSPAAGALFTHTRSQMNSWISKTLHMFRQETIPDRTILQKKKFSDRDNSPTETILRQRQFSDRDSSPKETVLRQSMTRDNSSNIHVLVYFRLWLQDPRHLPQWYIMQTWLRFYILCLHGWIIIDSLLP